MNRREWPTTYPAGVARAGTTPRRFARERTTAMATLAESDEGKDVVTSNGEKIGIVKAVSHERAHVDPDPGLTDELKTSLGWADRDDDTYPVAETEIETVTEDELRLAH